MKPLKTTIKAMLINVGKEQKKIIDDMMIVFSTAVRYSFNRLLDNVEIKDLEKQTAAKYKLNIRQAKDAVEKARQIIASQRKLVKMEYENYTHKIKAIENKITKLDEEISKKKRKGLLSKLDKRKRRQAYYNKHMDAGTIPPVIFGTKEMFHKRCTGAISNAKWKACRNNHIVSRGDKTKKGNPNLRVVLNCGMSFLEISTIEKTEKNLAIKIQVPIYLPHKLSKKTGRINGINYREMFLNYLKTGEAYQVEIIKNDDKYYVHLTIEEKGPEVIDLNSTERIGIDTNPDGFGATVIDSRGNYKESFYLKEHELLYARSSRRINLCGELVKDIVVFAKERSSNIAIEDLKFKDDKDVTKRFARIKHQFIYRTLLTMLERACIRSGTEVIKVKPQMTSKIGLYKYCHQYKLGVHNGAAMVIARRSYGFSEKVPKLLKDKLIGEDDHFNKENEWKKWSIINKNIEMRGGKTPGLWLRNRKNILEKAKVS